MGQNDGQPCPVEFVGSIHRAKPTTAWLTLVTSCVFGRTHPDTIRQALDQGNAADQGLRPTGGTFVASSHKRANPMEVEMSVFTRTMIVLAASLGATLSINAQPTDKNTSVAPFDSAAISYDCAEMTGSAIATCLQMKAAASRNEAKVRELDTAGDRRIVDCRIAQLRYLGIGQYRLFNRVEKLSTPDCVARGGKYDVIQTEK